MASSTETQQGKALGWYALQRVRMAELLKQRHNKEFKGSSEGTTSVDSSMAKDSSTSSNTSELEKAVGEDSNGRQTHTKNEGADDEVDTTNAKPCIDSKDAKKLQAVVRESHTILAKAHSVFPLQLFPDSVNIDRHKLTIVRRQFFGMEQKVSVPLENVKNIEADFGPLFGSITITSDLFINNTQEVKSLWRDDAKKIQKLVQGAVVAQGEGIDLNKIDVNQLRSLLIDLGSGHSRSM
ncbi:hypothetical protein H7097_00240 [Aeromicrobium sp.]|nr:hypothetical protein [Candidatus Saccharibacteria bacterium]